MFIKRILLLLLMISFASCEKKIELHPENSEQKVAVEAMFTDFSSVSYVILSKSKGLYEDILNHEFITDADVKIIDQTTQDTIHFEFDPTDNDHKYRCTTGGIPGHIYQLDINADGQHITGTKTMTERIVLNRVISVQNPENTDEYFLKIKFEDPPEQEDYYLVILQPQNSNSGLESKFTAMSDLTYDRNEQTLTLNKDIFHKDEDWLVLFFHIDRENYNYFRVIERAKRSLVNGAHPFFGLSLGNPASTVNGDQTIGYYITSPVALSPIHIGN